MGVLAAPEAEAAGMIEVHPNLFVGDEKDALAAIGPDWFVIHACKEPYHRAALGYTGRAAPPEHPEYLFAYRPDCLILNLVDAPDLAMIRAEVISEAIDAIGHYLLRRKKVLVHCNRGESRAPTIALLYLALCTETFDDCDFDQAVERFSGVYPTFAPAAGMAGYARQLWAGSGDGHAELADRLAAIPEPEPVAVERPKVRAIFTL